MQPSVMSSERAPQEYLHKDKIQSLQDEEYLKWAFVDAQRNASQSVHLNNFSIHDVSQLSPQLSMFSNSSGHFLQIETQTKRQDASRSSLLKSPQTQMTPLVGKNIEKLLDIQNCYKLKNNMPSQLMNTTQSQDLRVYSALEQDINVMASLSIPDIQANLAIASCYVDNKVDSPFGCLGKFDTQPESIIKLAPSNVQGVLGTLSTPDKSKLTCSETQQSNLNIHMPVLTQSHIPQSCNSVNSAFNPQPSQRKERRIVRRSLRARRRKFPPIEHSTQ